MNYESPFIRHSFTLVGTAALGFFVFMTVARPFGNAVAPSMRTQTASEIAALNRTRPAVSIPEPDGIDAESYIVRLAGEPIPLLSRREMKRMPPASLTKLMTAVVAREELDVSDRVAFSQTAKESDPLRSSAKAGESFFRDDVLKFAIMGSANDAAYALAEAVERKHQITAHAPARAIFSELMNRKAAQLGMADSRFQNPIGVDDADHFMSAADMTRLLEYILRTHQGIFEISRARETTLYSTDHQSHTVINTNDLLKEFPAILGSKTGFTSAAQGTLAMVYPIKPNRAALIVIMGSRDRFGDGRKLIRWLEDSF